MGDETRHILSPRTCYQGAHVFVTGEDQASSKRQKPSTEATTLNGELASKGYERSRATIYLNEKRLCFQMVCCWPRIDPPCIDPPLDFKHLVEQSVELDSRRGDARLAGGTGGRSYVGHAERKYETPNIPVGTSRCQGFSSVT